MWLCIVYIFSYSVHYTKLILLPILYIYLPVYNCQITGLLTSLLIYTHSPNYLTIYTNTPHTTIHRPAPTTHYCVSRLYSKTMEPLYYVPHQNYRGSHGRYQYCAYS